MHLKIIRDVTKAAFASWELLPESITASGNGLKAKQQEMSTTITEQQTSRVKVSESQVWE